MSRCPLATSASPLLLVTWTRTRSAMPEAKAVTYVPTTAATATDTGARCWSQSAVLKSPTRT
jgi:quinolinate synthase